MAFIQAQGNVPTGTKTHLSLLLPERKSDLLVQHPGSDQETKLDAQLPVREGMKSRGRTVSSGSECEDRESK